MYESALSACLCVLFVLKNVFYNEWQTNPSNNVDRAMLQFYLNPAFADLKKLLIDVMFVDLEDKVRGARNYRIK